MAVVPPLLAVALGGLGAAAEVANSDLRRLKTLLQVEVSDLASEFAPQELAPYSCHLSSQHATSHRPIAWAAGA